jgi:uncharacterized RDD family membrane protein YckC
MYGPQQSANTRQIPPRETSAGSLPYASFWQRVGASLIDGILLFVATLLGSWSVGFLYGASAGGNANLETAEGLGTVVGIAIPWLYFALMESSSRQATLGKTCAGIIVTDDQGERISFGKATGRFFGKYLSAIIFLVGYIMAAFTPKRQALHDILAGCLVLQGRQQANHQTFRLTH